MLTLQRSFSVVTSVVMKDNDCWPVFTLSVVKIYPNSFHVQFTWWDTIENICECECTVFLEIIFLSWAQATNCYFDYFSWFSNWWKKYLFNHILLKFKLPCFRIYTKKFSHLGQSPDTFIKLKVRRYIRKWKRIY